MRRTASNWCSGGSLGAFAGRSTRWRCSSTICNGWTRQALSFLEHLVTHAEVRHLLLVGAYRDNEVGVATRSCARSRRSTKLERGSRRSCSRLSGLTTWRARLRCAALHARSRALLWRNWCTRRRPAIHSSPSSSSPRWPRKGCSGVDPDAGAWVWDLARIRAHGYTDNVVDLMFERLKRLSGTAQTALQQLACLGNVAEITTLSVVFGRIRRGDPYSLLDAARAGLIFRLEGSYAFLHDRIQEAAYALIPEGERAGAHLRIGRVLLATMSEDQLDEHLFDVANQLNRGAGRLADPDEKAELATFNLRTGRRAKASAAYASARTYFASGIALLDGRDWSSQHELKFSLFLEFAECELLCGGLEKAAQLIGELLAARGFRCRVRERLLPEDQFSCIDRRTPASHRQRAHVPASVRH